MDCDKCGNRIETSWEAGHNRCKKCVDRELRKRADGANDLRIQNNMMKCCLRWIYEAVDDWYCCNTVREQIKSVYPDIEGDNIESLNQARKPIVDALKIRDNPPRTKVNLQITVEILPGSRRDDANQEMQELANKLGMNVTGEFAGKMLVVEPRS